MAPSDEQVLQRGASSEGAVEMVPRLNTSPSADNAKLAILTRYAQAQADLC